MERIKLAEKIISTCREMNASGLNQGTSGNVSAVYRWHVDYAEWDRLFKDDAGHDCLCRR